MSSEGGEGGGGGTDEPRGVDKDAEALETLLATGNPKIRLSMDTLVTKVKRRRFRSSMELTLDTMQLVRILIGSKRWKNPKDLLQVIRAFGRRMVKARPTELVVGNAFRRIIHLIKEEYFRMLKEEEEQEQEQDDGASEQIAAEDVWDHFDPKNSVLPSREIGMHNLKMKDMPSLGSAIVENISEIISEIENLEEPISKQALEHIHAEDVILTFGESNTVLTFLEAAKRKRHFKVIVAEASPGYSGHEMAARLAEMGVETTLISDAALFAMMPRVNKVIIGTRAVMANGGLLAAVGTRLLCQAAKCYSVPVICVTGLYKLCPLFPHKLDAFIDLGSPGPTCPYVQVGSQSDHIQVISPSSDYVPPDLVSLFVTNTGGHQPSYVYRLLAEYYDINAEEELSLE